MPAIKSNGLTLEIEEYGDASRPAVLLIMGLAAQLTRWPRVFVESLVNAGYRVIAFDNRDAGLSDKLDSQRASRPAWVALMNSVGLASFFAPYKLIDMAQDTVGILDALNIERAHIIGASMGGMIGQILCAEHAQRIRSFTAIMSSTGNPELPRAHPHIIKEIFTGRTGTATREESIANTLHTWTLIGTKDSGRDPDEFKAQVVATIDRNTTPAGIRRQIAAIIASRDLREWTRKIEAPSLVLHGSDDPLVPVQCGMDIAATIKNAHMEIIQEMGHDLPPRFINTISEHVVGHLHAADKNNASEQAA